MTTFESAIEYMDVDELQFENASRHELRNRAAHFIKKIVSFMPLEAPNYMSEHYHADDNESA